MLKLAIKLVVLWVSIILPISLYADTIKIGLRAHLGATKSLLQWQATADYLSRAIPQHEFVMVPLVGLDELMQATERNEFDFVLTNPSSFVEMQVRYGASAIVTLKNKRQGKPYTQFGSVIFTLAGRDDINEIIDLKGKVLAAVSERAFGGWRVALREMLKNGVSVDDLENINFVGGIQSDVVDIVEAGVADAGVVRTDMLERLATERNINLDKFKIINQKHSKYFPFYRSTPLYPEWAFSKMKGTSDDLSKKVTLALLNINSSQNAARVGRYVGWTVPENYEPVHELMRDLRVGPYVDFNQSLFELVNKEYRFEAAVIFSLLLIIIITTSYVLILNKRLELRVLQRTNALLLAKDEAERASHAKSEFLSSMSHELRTPMNAILGYAQLMEYQAGKIDREQRKEFVAEILHAGNHLLDLINDLLDVSKIEAGKYEVEVSPISIVNIVDECIELVSVLADERSIQIKNNLSEDNRYMVLVDKRSFKQILINLLSNAIKYNSKGGVVTVDADCDDKYCILDIVDSGDGISKEQLEVIFEAYHRSTERRDVEGSGIGLGISKQLMEAMGGEMFVESELGKGSKFSLKIFSKIRK